MNYNDLIFVTGHNGLVGRAIVRALRLRGFSRILTVPRTEVDLRDPVQVRWFFSVHRPEYVFHCAARVGGIKANREHPLEFFLENMDMERNVICNAAEYGVKKLLFLGSSCIYPKNCVQPIQESSLMTGLIDQSTEPYAIAKIAGIRLCQWLHDKGHNFVSAMPCNLFGPDDCYNEVNAHCVPGMMARMHKAKKDNSPSFIVWGNSSVRRELLFVDDLAEALLLVMDKYDDRAPINTGSGQEFYMAEIATKLAKLVGFSGTIDYDFDQPIGVSRKVMDNSKITTLGWTPQTSIDEALRVTYNNFCINELAGTLR